MMLKHEIHLLELRIEKNVCDPHSIRRYSSSSEKGPERGLEP